LCAEGLQEAGPNAYSTLCKTQPRPEHHLIHFRSSWLLGAASREILPLRIFLPGAVKFVPNVQRMIRACDDFASRVN
jgi:hypothetical protein